MARRLLDIALSLLVLTVAAPLLLLAMFLIWAEDGRPPLYRGRRVGLHDRDFMMVKLRSMMPDADRQGGSSTARSDGRVTGVGRVVRRWKIDELPQFWNVLRGEMSVVGPRPNVRADGVDRYTPEERRLLTIRPGITDLSSIVFSDEADILDGAADPHALYDLIIRPWKSRLGLLYVDHRTIGTDLRLIWLTVLAIIAKRRALTGVDAILARWGADPQLRHICARHAPPSRAEPPGAMA